MFAAFMMGIEIVITFRLYILHYISLFFIQLKDPFSIISQIDNSETRKVIMVNPFSRYVSKC